MNETFVVVFVDNLKLIYDVCYGTDKKHWGKILQTLDKERYSAKFFGSENARANANEYIKMLEKRTYRKTKVPFCF